VVGVLGLQHKFTKMSASEALFFCAQSASGTDTRGFNVHGIFSKFCQ